MRPRPRLLVRSLVAAGLVAASGLGAAQSLSASYALTTPSRGPELAPRVPLFTTGPWHLAAAASSTGSGLSLQAGEQWFARIGMGRSLDTELFSLGGGYRFDDGRALSMHLTRQVGQGGLGLALRYDLAQSFLRLAYESPLRAPGTSDALRFSAGLRF